MIDNKLKGLFLNTKEEICSIYESGKMCFNCLVQSNLYTLDYVEISKENRIINLDYDFYIFNYHFDKMKWMDTEYIKKIPGFKSTIVLEMSQNSPFDCVSPNIFDAYIVLDPTCNHPNKNVYSFPRPLESYAIESPDDIHTNIPIIGTFGLSYSDKGFDEVIKAVNEEFEEAIVKINVPISSNSLLQSKVDFLENIKSIKIKKGIILEITNNYFSKKELIDWCSLNTLNVFLYNRRIGNGLSATTDQAISSGRPLAISTNPTFRHIHTYIKPYPYQSLKESILSNSNIVKNIQNDWSQKNFYSKFEKILEKHSSKFIIKSHKRKIKLRKYNRFKSMVTFLFSKQGLIYFTPPIFYKLKKVNYLNYDFTNKDNIFSNAISKIFIHQTLNSNSFFQEDLLVDYILNKKEKGFYVDIGVRDPYYNNHTAHFYAKGWKGINIEPFFNNYKKINYVRKDDINLNISIGNHNANYDYSVSVKNDITFENKNLNEVFDIHLKNKMIDFLSINTRENNFKILETNNWEAYRPTIVLVNAGLNSRDIQLFLETRNYLYIYGNDKSSIFIDKMSKNKSILEAVKWN